MPPSPIDEYESKGKDILKGKISPFVAANKPINFVMLGFPMKSQNDRNKVLGKLPDRGEAEAMINFKKFDEAIKSVYPPGVHVSIVSDGYAFNELLGAPDKIVAEYNEAARDLAKGSPITWHEMFDFYSRGLSLHQMREKVTTQFGISPEELERRILMDPDVNSLYRGMIIFMEEELAMQNFPSRNQLQKAAKKLAREMMVMNEAYSALIRDNFKDHIRLSMHPSVNSGAKYSFQLVPGKKIRHSPWHSALVLLKDNSFETKHKKDAIAAGHTLITKDGLPFYFIEN